MKVLVTGGAGFIGSHTVDALLRQGHQVRVVDSLEPPVHRTKEPPVYLPKDVEFFQGDVRDGRVMEAALRGVDAVYHFAAHQGYLPDFSSFASVNDVGTALMYETIVANHLPIQKVVLASSQAVYGEGRYSCSEHGALYPVPRLLQQLREGDWDVKCPECGRPLQSLPTNETVVNPHNQYSVSKYAQELYALTLGQNSEYRQSRFASASRRGHARVFEMRTRVSSGFLHCVCSTDFSRLSMRMESNCGTMCTLETWCPQIS